MKDRLSELSCAGEDMLIMDGLTLFGLLAVTAMLVFYAMEDHNPMYILAFAGACSPALPSGPANRTITSGISK